MRWQKKMLMMAIGLSVIFSLTALCATASTIVDRDFWGTVFERHGSIMFLVEVESGKIIAANQAAAAFYGYSIAELQNMNIDQLHMYSPDELAKERLAAADEERNYFIFPHRLASGEIRTVEVSSYPIDEEQTLLFSIINDITARQEAELDLLEKNARLRRAEMITGLGSWEFRLSDDQLFLSPGAEKILGLVSGDPMPALHEITVPEYRQVRDKALKDLIEENIPYDIELKFIRPADGAIIDVHSIGEYDPETNSVFGTLLDITQRKAAEQALETSRQRNQFLLIFFVVLQLIAIIVLISNILQRRKAQRETQQNLERNESLVRILQHPTDSVQELLDHAVVEAVGLTGSKIGCICLYDQEKQTFTPGSCSSNNPELDTLCKLYQTSICDEAIQLGRPIIANGCLDKNSTLDVSSRTKQPINFLALPIFDQEEIVACIGLADKPTGYDHMDTWQITLLTNGMWTNIERRRSESALRREKERLRTTLLSVGDGVIATDEHGRVEIINSVAQTLTGWGPEALGQPFEQVFNIINEDTGETCEDPVQKVLSTGNHLALANHTVLRSRGGQERPIADSAAPIRNSDGEVTGAVLVFRDVTEEQRRMDEIEYLSFHDQLTGLYNRRFFERKIQDWDRAKNLPLSIMMADLNNLKLVNDTFGHAVGDQFLTRTAQIFQKVCRARDVIARWGGDEFVFLLPKTTSEEADLVASKIERALQNEEIESISISVALGWATKTMANEDLGSIFKSAENNMYRAKLFQNSSIRSETIQALMTALYEKNEREEQHSKRVSALCQHVARQLGLTDREVKELGIVGLFHDIGKIAIDEQILNKEGPLTSEEWTEIMRHPEIGYRLLGAVHDMADIATYVLAHHERWDGLGYPRGIEGTDIPLQARIVAVVDAYDAMVSERPYKNSLTKREAIDELKRNAGKQFDPNLVDVVIEAINERDGAAVGG